MSRKAMIDVLAMNALRGRLTAIPTGISAADVLREFWNIGGVSLPDKPEDTERRALRFSDADTRISHIIVNTVEGDIHIGLLLDCPEFPATQSNILSRNGFLAYVYVPTYPYNSELGYCYFEIHADKSIRRIG
ncbi:MAG: hypothetical protein IJI25_11075 [Eubacterium sp.]|nr:hypothetical protein [Eubacterium sp.]